MLLKVIKLYKLIIYTVARKFIKTTNLCGEDYVFVWLLLLVCPTVRLIHLLAEWFMYVLHSISLYLPRC